MLSKNSGPAANPKRIVQATVEVVLGKHSDFKGDKKDCDSQAFMSLAIGKNDRLLCATVGPFVECFDTR